MRPLIFLVTGRFVFTHPDIDGRPEGEAFRILEGRFPEDGMENKLIDCIRDASGELPSRSGDLHDVYLAGNATLETAWFSTWHRACASRYTGKLVNARICFRASASFALLHYDSPDSLAPILADLDVFHEARERLHARHPDLAADSPVLPVFLRGGVLGAAPAHLEVRAASLARAELPLLLSGLPGVDPEQSPLFLS